jgi:hypothetical protein
VRPAMPLICQFIASRRQDYGVAPICRALSVLGVPIAPRTYRVRGSKSRLPTLNSELCRSFVLVDQAA